MHPESSLIAALKARDKDAYGKLYDQYGNALFGLIMKIVKSDSVAEDVLQESFVKIWKRIDQYDEGKGRFFTWILNITRNTAIDHWRAMQRKSAVDIDQPALQGAAGLDRAVECARSAASRDRPYRHVPPDRPPAPGAADARLATDHRPECDQYPISLP